jgi:hypothetical protein
LERRIRFDLCDDEDVARLASTACGQKAEAVRRVLPGSLAERPQLARPNVPELRVAASAAAQRHWANYFRHGVSKSTFDYVREFTWRRVICWLRHKHPHANWKWLLRRYLPRWWPTDGEVVLFDIGKVTVTRDRYRGHRIPTPWSWALEDTVA